MGDELYNRLRDELSRMHVSVPESGNISDTKSSSKSTGNNSNSNIREVRVQPDDKENRKNNRNVSKNTGNIEDKLIEKINDDDEQKTKDKKDNIEIAKSETKKKKKYKRYQLADDIKEEELDNIIKKKEDEEKERDIALEKYKRYKEKKAKNKTQTKPKELIKEPEKPITKQASISLNCKKCGNELLNTSTYFTNSNVPYLSATCSSCNIKNTKKKPIKKLTTEEYDKYKSSRRRNASDVKVEQETLDILRDRLKQKQQEEENPKKE